MRAAMSTPAILEKKIELSSEGTKVSGILRVPAGLAPGERRPAVLCLQGFSVVKEALLAPNAVRLTELGYVTLIIDYRGFGESAGEPRCRLVPPAQVQDARNALTYLETVAEVDASKLGLFGISLGASVALGTAGLDPRVKALIAIAGPADLERVWSAFPDFPKFRAKVEAARRDFVATGKVTYSKVIKLLSSDPHTCALLEQEAPKHPSWRLEVTFESLLDLFTFRPEEVAKDMRGASLFICPEEDALIAKGELTSMFAKAPQPRELFVIPGIRHVDVYQQGPGFEPIMARTAEFLGRYLPR